MSNESHYSGGIGFGGLLAIVLITLKLLGKVSWSWWWVTAPLWGVPAAIAVFLVLVVVAAACVGIFKRLKRSAP